MEIYNPGNMREEYISVVHENRYALDSIEVAAGSRVVLQPHVPRKPTSEESVSSANVSSGNVAILEAHTRPVARKQFG